MNHLAHFLLSGNEPDIIIGNFITDYIKKKEVATYEQRYGRGIALHRAIDSFTDNHPAVRKANAKMRRLQNKYTPVVMDVCFDHLLARNWDKFSDQSLREYTSQMYDLLVEHQANLPLRLQRSVKGMVEGDWLYSFLHRKGLSYTFSLLKRRLKFENRLEFAVDDLYEQYDFYEDLFLTFFQELADHAQEFRNTLPANN